MNPVSYYMMVNGVRTKRRLRPSSIAKIEARKGKLGTCLHCGTVFPISDSTAATPNAFCRLSCEDDYARDTVAELLNDPSALGRTIAGIYGGTSREEWKKRR
jgi:hypothetical protein